MMRRYTLFLIAASMLFLLISCSSGQKDKDSGASNSTAGITAQQQTTLPKTSAATTAENTAPLAAVVFKVPAAGVRPIAVMIDNEGTRELPQGGLDKAQVIYEIIVEGGETRYMAVFWDEDPTMVGPVRSSRDYFLDYSMENDAIYVHFGWSPKAKKDISALKINNINGVANGGEIFWDLTKDRGNWQDSYTSMEKILGYVKKAKYRTTTDKEPVFKYNQAFAEPAGGQAANKVTVRYDSSVYSSYEYDPASKTYLRFRKGVPHMERVSGKQLTAANIIVQYTHNGDIKGDDKGRQTVTTTGSGSGYYISCGKEIKIRWSKESRSAQTKYTDESGNAITINPGQTWVQILPVTGKVTFESNN